MAPTDPRERYDDLFVRESHTSLPPDEFAETAASEAATAGWVVLGFVIDDDGRVLLVDQDWAEGWLAPGGTHKPGETLAETAVREVREETGVEIDPVRPHAVDDFTFENEATGETGGWTAVAFEATARTTTIADDLGVADEEILAARWFDSLPAAVFNPDLTARVYERCLADRA